MPQTLRALGLSPAPDAWHGDPHTGLWHTGSSWHGPGGDLAGLIEGFRQSLGTKLRTSLRCACDGDLGVFGG